MLSPSEETMWNDDRPEKPPAKDDREINDRYTRGEGRIVIETNREKLPGFVSAIKEPGYMDLRPFYQRRPRWSRRKQSLLIESFIMNIPVPPVFLYERDFNSYEVMDGQQRITAIRDFYENRFALTGLEMWPELEGRKYHSLPEKVKAGVDRRSITSIVLLKESTADEEEAWELRETVFERLNTGGVELEHQEIRNALYQSPFNNLLFDLAELDDFRAAWDIPRHVENEIEKNPEILKNGLFSRMEDLEIILRFFALRHVDYYRRGMQGFLDIYMMKAVKFENEDVESLGHLFVETLHTAVEIFKEQVFRPYNAISEDWERRPHKAFADAVMVGISRNLSHSVRLIAEREAVIEGTKQLFRDNPKGTFTGRGNTKADIRERIDLFSQMLQEVVDN